MNVIKLRIAALENTSALQLFIMKIQFLLPIFPTFFQIDFTSRVSFDRKNFSIFFPTDQNILDATVKCFQFFVNLIIKMKLIHYLAENGMYSSFYNTAKFHGNGGRNFKKFVNIGNKERKRHKRLILMLNLKVSKQTRYEVSKNKIIIKRVSNISMN